MNEEKFLVYLDNSNYSQVSEETIKSMNSYFPPHYGHPALIHKAGRNSQKVVKETKDVISNTINCKPSELTFTSGLTEANNIALQGASYAKREKGDHILISKLEPPSISRVAAMLSQKGFKVDKIGVDSEGFINLDELQEKITDDTILVSISGVADEIGTIEPLKAVNEIIEDTNSQITFHTDFSNGYTKHPINVRDVGVDILTVGGRKINAPPGIGFLFSRKGEKITKIMEGPLITSNIRPGMANIPLIVGMRKSITTGFRKKNNTLTLQPSFIESIRKLRDELYDKIKAEIDEILLNGPNLQKGIRSPSNLNISFKRVEGEAITLRLSKKGVYVATGSACARRSLQASPVLKAIGRVPEESHGSIIFEISRYNKMEEINYVADVLPNIISELREISAL